MKATKYGAGIFILVFLALSSILSICYLFRIWTPTPSEATILKALISQFPHENYGLEDNGLTYHVTEISKPTLGAIADAKFWIWLEVHDAEGKQIDGLVNIAIIRNNSYALAVGDLITREQIAYNTTFLSTNFTENEIMEIQKIMSSSS